MSALPYSAQYRNQTRAPIAATIGGVFTFPVKVAITRLVDDLIASVSGIVGRGMMLVGQGPMLMQSGRNDSEGVAAPPSLRMDRKGTWGPLIVVVEPGARSFTVAAKWSVRESILPRVRLVASSEVGVPSDVIVAATGSADTWNDIEVSFTAGAAGAVEVYLEKRTDGTNGPVYWDRIQVT